jgi:hypothetical protein
MRSEFWYHPNTTTTALNKIAKGKGLFERVHSLKRQASVQTEVFFYFYGPKPFSITVEASKMVLPPGNAMIHSVATSVRA